MNITSKLLYPSLKQLFSDPFAGFELIGLSSGKKATAEIEHDLIHASEKRNIAMEDFKTNRLSTNSTASFFDPIKKLNLKTFSNLVATTKVKANGKDVIMKADKELLG